MYLDLYGVMVKALVRRSRVKPYHSVPTPILYKKILQKILYQIKLREYLDSNPIIYMYFLDFI